MPRIDLDRAGWPTLSETALAVASRVLGFDHPDVPDVAQEALALALEHADRFHPHLGTATAWVATITRNHGISFLRRQRPWRRLGTAFEEGEIDLADPLELDVPDLAALAEEVALAFADLARIPVRRRILFILARELRPLEGCAELRAFEARFGLPYEAAMADPSWRDLGLAGLASRAGIEYETLTQIVHRVQEDLVELADRRMSPVP